MANKHTKERKDNCTALLRECVKPGDTLYTHVDHVARSGMSRHIHVYKIENNEPRWLSGLIAGALGYSQAKDDSLKVSGCGMDMGFEVVYQVSSFLFRDGFDCLGPGCPSNDHNNGDRNYEPHHHQSGGYALKQRWL